MFDVTVRTNSFTGVVYPAGDTIKTTYVPGKR